MSETPRDPAESWRVGCERIDRTDRAERALLGAILREPAVMDDVAPVIAVDRFRVDAHRLVYESILELYESGSQIDLVTVGDRLRVTGRMGDVTWGYLGELHASEFSGAAAAQYAQIVRDGAMLRDLTRLGQQIVHLGEHPHGPADEMVNAAERGIFALAERGIAGTIMPFSQVVGQALDHIDRRIAVAVSTGEPVTGEPSGVGQLDNLTAGFHPGELVIVAARPSVGKTSVAVAIARTIATARPVLFASLEQSRHELAQRMLCAESGVLGDNVRRGELSDRDQGALIEAGARLSPLHLHIDDAGEQSVLRLAANARRLKRRQGLGAVIVDYLQLVSPDDRRAPRHEQVGATSRRLKALARELEVPLIALAQLNREVEGRAGQKPRLSDLRESGSIEADADTVILLHPLTESPGCLCLIVAKQRNGPTGEVVVRFDRARMRFSGQQQESVSSPF